VAFDRVKGEYVPQLGHVYRIVPASKWQGSPFWPEACESAAAAFKAAGYSKKVAFFDENVLVQEYPITSKLVFFFCMQIQGRDYYTHYECEFNEHALGMLRGLGMWEDFASGKALQ
jgi:hypothetical protein